MGPPISLMLLAITLYVKYSDVRSFVDRTCPWVKNNIGRYAPAFPVEPKPEPPSVEFQPAPSRPTAAVAATPVPAPKPFNLATVCAEAGRWPKSVAIKKAVEIPSVIGGNVVGKLRLTAGCEVHVASVRDGKVGIEYRGGGAWLDLESTDFVERARQEWR